MKKYWFIVLTIALVLPVFGMGNAPAINVSGGKVMETSAAGSQILNVSADTWVYAFRPDKNYGDGGGWKDITNPDEPTTLPKMFLGFGGSDKKIALFKFDLSTLNKSKEIKNASLAVYNDFAGSAAAIKVDAKKINSPWEEMKVTYKTRPGTDKVLSTMTLQGAIGYKDSGKWYRFDITEAVRAWQAGAANYGIMLDPQGDSGVDFDLVAREYSDKSQYAPRIEVVY